MTVEKNTENLDNSYIHFISFPDLAPTTSNKATGQFFGNAQTESIYCVCFKCC